MTIWLMYAGIPYFDRAVQFISWYGDPLMVVASVTLGVSLTALGTLVLVPELHHQWRRARVRREGMKIPKARLNELKAGCAEYVAQWAWDEFHAGNISWEEGEYVCQLIGDVLTIRELIPRNRDPLKEAIRKRLDEAGKLPAHLKVVPTEEVKDEGTVTSSKLQQFVARVRSAAK